RLPTPAISPISLQLAADAPSVSSLHGTALPFANLSAPSRPAFAPVQGQVPFLSAGAGAGDPFYTHQDGSAVSPSLSAASAQSSPLLSYGAAPVNLQRQTITLPVDMSDYIAWSNRQAARRDQSRTPPPVMKLEDFL
ncbi:hypothetical protein HDU91_004433, partial [Kappamyces sp. JEL0680]